MPLQPEPRAPKTEGTVQSPDSCERRIYARLSLSASILTMRDACTLRQVVSWAVVATAIALCSSCNSRPGETSSARGAGKKETTPPAGSAARLSNDPPENTFEHPALQEQLVHEKWHGDLDGIVNRRLLRILVAPNKLGFYFDGSEIHGGLYEFCREFERFLNHKLHTGNLAIHLAYIPVTRGTVSCPSWQKVMATSSRR